MLQYVITKDNAALFPGYGISASLFTYVQVSEVNVS